MAYLLSDILNQKFNIYKVSTCYDDGTSIYTVTVYSSGTKTNYGKLLKDLPHILHNIYKEVDDEKDSDISNNNRGELVWYIDGSDDITIKENLPRVSNYAIHPENVINPILWISKPSDPYIGSGKYIMIGTKKNVENRPNIIHNKKIFKNWIVQPLITDLILWKSKFKFDIRMFSVIFNLEDNFYALCSKMCIGRVCVRKHDPVKDPSSAITNISVQERIPGYTYKKNMPLITDDLGVCKKLTQDLLDNTKLTRDPEKEFHILILGLDVMFSSYGDPILIEVNKDPALEWKISNNERIVSDEIIVNVFGYLIPALTRYQNIFEIDNLDIIKQNRK